MMYRQTYRLHHQQGYTLVLSLVMLLLVTLVATSAVHSAKSEHKMAASFADKQRAIQLAKTAIEQAEQWVYQQPFVAKRDFSMGCQQQDLCFNVDCYHGLCATAYLDQGGVCVLKNSESWANQQPVNGHYSQNSHWKLLDVWNDPQRHRTLKIPYQSIVYEVKYLVEFFCFTPRYASLARPKPWPEQPHAWSPVFRITVLAGGVLPHTSAMVRSVIKQR